MRDYQARTKDMIIALAIICVFLFMFRLWPLILVVLFVGGVVLLKRCIFPKKNEQETQPVIIKPTVEVFDDQDLWGKKYEFASEKISCLVENAYPNARWVWENVNWRESIQKNEDVYIRLNKEGGYKRAKIMLQDGFVSSMEFLPEDENVPAVETTQQIVPKKKKDDSGRIAFEWVETHLLELNTRCNEIIGQGESELMITISELPEEKYWEAICNELKKEGLEQIEIIPSDGIKIILK